jgi:hypothetical protein
MTRNYPMAKVPGEETDHPHHRSLWFAHGPVNGVDVWTERKNTGRHRPSGLCGHFLRREHRADQDVERLG